ncbi:MAG: peptidylprolyl isomerase [Candidatus Omnitrophica bacterium]|nr:peptidylprolyl isomerase [Candidatus Omnitrophota bacterium]
MRKQILCVILIYLFIGSGLELDSVCAAKEETVAGTFFGEPVSADNYYFILKTVLSFSSPWGGVPRNREQLNKRVWDDLILSYEAHRRKITVNRKDLEKKIDEMLKGSQVSFDWKKERDLYAQWVKETFSESTETFEHQMRHLAQLQILYEQILDSIPADVSEEEAFQEFMNEHNNLSVELVEFDKLDEALKFYQEVKDSPTLWQQKADEDKKENSDGQSFRRPGFVALEFLIEVWKFPKDAVYDMMEMKIGDIYSPVPIYEGYGVFKILDIRRADGQIFLKDRQPYFNQLHARKRYQGFVNWLKALKRDADIQIYIDPPPEIFS